MTQKTHITFGVVFCVAIHAISDSLELSEYAIDFMEDRTDSGLSDSDSLIQSTSLFLYLWAGLSALVPDLDHAKASLGKQLGFKGLGKIIRFLVSDKHRGPTHTLEFCFLYAFAVGGIMFLLTGTWMWPVFYVSFLGCFSHLLIDMFNNRGVRLTLINRGKYYSLVPGNYQPVFRLLFSLFYAMILGYLLIIFLSHMEIPDYIASAGLELDDINLFHIAITLLIAGLFFWGIYRYRGVETGSDRENKVVFPFISFLTVILAAILYKSFANRLIDHDTELLKDYPQIWLVALLLMIFIFIMLRKRLFRFKALSLWLVLCFASWCYLTVLGWDNFYDYYVEKGENAAETIRDVKDSLD
ncbi:MAG: metal-dependent hydrolase [Spirochaetota bacterium]|nr:metal-dependent hydrolase [Spirochaetota bacterium]